MKNLLANPELISLIKAADEEKFGSGEDVFDRLTGTLYLNSNQAACKT
jgi:hypothetical protein